MKITHIIRMVCIMVAALTCGPQIHAISEGNVLVIYNSQDSTSTAIKDYYLSKRSGVLTFDLNSNLIGPGNISYADFISQIRDPIRNYLNSNNLESTIQVLVLTKNLPHRIQSLDLSNPNIGDSASQTNTAYGNGNVTNASVDSELTLLQFNLETGESAGSYDSAADNAVYNPYFDQTAGFSSYDRSNITDADREFVRAGTYGWWRLSSSRGAKRALDAGHIYLTARLDASTLTEVYALIDRAQAIIFRRDIDAILLDSDGRTGTTPGTGAPLQLYYPLFSTTTTIDDYAEAEAAFTSSWPQLLWNDDATFLVGSASTITYALTLAITGPVAHLHSYGVNHSGNNSSIRDYLSTFSGQLVNGASFSAYESFGAKGLGGLGNSNQAQVEEWFTAGGTFATGPVWEPFTIGISKSEIFLDRFLNQGLTYVEAAWSSILQISWQTVILGDPLATASVVDAEPYEKWIFDRVGVTPDINVDASLSEDLEDDGLANGIEYLLDLDPTAPDAGSTNLPRLMIAGDQKTFTFVMADPTPTEISIEVERSTSLAPESWTTIATRSPEGIWSGSATVNEEVVTAGRSVEVTDNEVITTDKRFYRISTDFIP